MIDRLPDVSPTDDKSFGRALLLYLAVLFLLFADVLFFGRTLDPYPFVPGVTGLSAQQKAGPVFCNDSGAVVWAFQPWNILIHHELFEEGEIPLWNPYQGTGMPLAANFQSGVFSPMQWPFFVSTSRWWWDYLFVLRLLLAGIFTFLFLGRIGLEFLPSWFGGLAYMLSGYLIDYINMNHIAVPLLLPAAMYFVETWRLERRTGQFLGMVLTLTLLILAGMPEATFLAGVLIGAFLVTRLLTEHRFWQNWLPWPWVFVLVVTLSGVLLLPGLEYLQLSSSKHFLHDWGSIRFQPGALITFLVPFFFGAPGLGWSADYGKAFLVPSGLGITVLVLAAVGLLCSRHRLRWFFAFYACLVLLKLFGPLSVQTIGKLPLLKWMIFTNYLQPSLAFCVAVLAALGLSAVFDRHSRAGTLLMVFGALGALILAGWLTYFSQQIIRFPQRLVVLSVLACTLFGITVALSIVTIGWIHRKGYRNSAPAVLVLAIAEILALGVRIHPVREERAPNMEFVKKLRQEGSEFRSIGDYPLFPNTATAARVSDLRFLDPILPERMLQSFSELTQMPLVSRLTFHEFDDYEDPILDLLGVRYVVSSQDIRNLLLRQRPRTTPDELWLENRNEPGIPLLLLDPQATAQFHLPSMCNRLSVLVQAESRATVRLLGPHGTLMSRTVDPGFHSLGPTPVGPVSRRSSIRVEADSEAKVYAAVTTDLSAETAGLLPLNLPGSRVRMFERPTALPVAFLVDSPELLEAQSIEELRKLRRESIAESDGSIDVAAQPGKVRLVRRTANRLNFDVQSDRPSHLFISITHYPGWSAEVNGVPVELERAALFMTALEVPAGHSHVVLHYLPKSVSLGLGFTLLGFILTLSTTLATTRKSGLLVGKPDRMIGHGKTSERP